MLGLVVGMRFRRIGVINLFLGLGLMFLFGCNDQPKAEPVNWQTVCEKWSRGGYESFTESERVWFNTRGFIDAINEGGLINFFRNHWGRYYKDTKFALGEIKAFEVVEILESYGAFFGEKVPYAASDRIDIIDSWDEGGRERVACAKFDTQLMPLIVSIEKKLEAYLIEQGLNPDLGI